MATMTIEIPEGKEAKWVNGVLTLVDEQPVEFKFKVGDKVAITHGEYKCYTIYLCGADNGKAYYWLKDENEVPHPKYPEDMLELYVEQPKDITERIKTFEDACRWCSANGKDKLLGEFDAVNVDWPRNDERPSSDILAYLKLRIITCALNEGWEPRPYQNDKRYYAVMNNQCTNIVRVLAATATGASTPHTLYFKAAKMAEYAATQFKDIYLDFCYKGKE